MHKKKTKCSDNSRSVSETKPTFKFLPQMSTRLHGWKSTDHYQHFFFFLNASQNPPPPPHTHTHMEQWGRVDGPITTPFQDFSAAQSSGQQSNHMHRLHNICHVFCLLHYLLEVKGILKCLKNSINYAMYPVPVSVLLVKLLYPSVGTLPQPPFLLTYPSFYGLIFILCGTDC